MTEQEKIEKGLVLAKEEYNDKYDEINKKQERIDEVENNELIKEYMELKRTIEDDKRILKQDYLNMKKLEYKTCNHVFITSGVSYNDRYSKETYKYAGCIKCGLDTSVLSHRCKCEEAEIMLNYLKDYDLRLIVSMNVPCDLDLACAIYKKIKENHQDIDDMTAFKYFEIALNNMRNKDVSVERKESRVKRLQLSEHFINWDGPKKIY